MVGLSYYLISFMYEGLRYHWVNELKAYYSPVSQLKFDKPPVDCTYTDADWVSQWRCDDDE